MRVVLSVPQVSELVTEYKREHLTVWGNADYEIVCKCFKEVRLSLAKLCYCVLTKPAEKHPANRDLARLLLMVRNSGL